MVLKFNDTVYILIGKFDIIGGSILTFSVGNDTIIDMGVFEIPLFSLKEYAMLNKIGFQKMGIGCIFIMFCLIILNCTTTGNTEQNGIEGVWVLDGSYRGNKIILIFRDDKNGIMYMMDNRVSFQNASVRNETLAMDTFQYNIITGSKIQFIFSDGKRYENTCYTGKNRKSLIFKDFLNNLFANFTFNKLKPKDEAIYLQIDKEKSGG
jgi:hypothetical protein